MTQRSEITTTVPAAVMAIAGVVELLFGVKAEGKSLEDIATPLSAQPAKATA